MVSILRVIFNAHIDVTDPTWNFIKVAILSTIEVNVGVCCACMPVIYPLFRVLVGRKINPSTEGTASIEARKSKEPSRRRRDFSQLDEGSSISHLWDSKLENNSSRSDGLNKELSDQIPMGRIVVTRDLDVERTGNA